jgi:hypothetical protein
VSSGNTEEVQQISYIINNFIISFTSFVVIVCSTIVLATKLRGQTKWLKQSTNVSQTNRLSNRNQKVAKMVVMISILFIVCFVPVCVLFLAMSLEPSLSHGGTNRNLLMLCGGIGLVLETLNSSMNIFVYFHMSTKYREKFSKMFKIKYQEQVGNEYNEI